MIVIGDNPRFSHRPALVPLDYYKFSIDCPVCKSKSPGWKVALGCCNSQVDTVSVGL